MRGFIQKPLGRVLVGIAILASAGAIALPVTTGGGGGGTTITCNQTAANAAGLTSALSAASNGQTICLTAAVSYGSFTGTNKAVTIIAQSGTGSPNPVNATMTGITFGPGDTGFTLDGGRASFGSVGLTVGGAAMEGAFEGDTQGPTNITVKNTAFTDQVFIDGSGTDGIVLDGNTHNFPFTSFEGSINAKIFLAQHLTGTLASPSVTVKNSQIWNSDLDGIHFGGGSGYIIDGNDLNNICQESINHTDNMQFDVNTFHDVWIKRNFLHQTTPCGTQGITEYDGGVDGAIIEDNVIALRWGPVLELYSDTNSIVRHNTLQFYLATTGPEDLTHCEFFNQTCGKMIFDHKVGDPAGTGTAVSDNIATGISFQGGSTGTTSHNMCKESGCTGTGTLTAAPTYVGGTSPLTYAGFCLAPGSNGENAASDGLDIGIRC